MNNQIEEEKMMIENENEITQTEMKEQEIQQEKELQEDVEQKERDEKIRKQLNQINQQFVEIIDRVEIHKKILQEINQTEEIKQIESAQQLKFTKKSFQENQIKLEKLLLSIDSLVGASEKLRPEKKRTVNQIQKSINEIDGLLGELKSIENKIEKLQKEKQKQQEEQIKTKDEQEIKQEQVEKIDQQEEEKQEKQEEMRSEQDQELSEQQQEKQKLEKEDEQMESEEKEESFEEERAETISQQNVIPQNTNQTKQEKEESEFPFPSKEQWQLLTFEPKFNIQQLQNKYLLSSNIPNLNAEEIKIKTSEGILTIEGVKYPNEQEKQLLIKKLLQSVNNPHLLRSLTANQIISAILKIASQYNFGKFSVKYELPSNFDSSQDVDATYKNGVLQIELPIRNKPRQNPFTQQYFRPEVPFYGQRSRRPNSFWDFF